MNLTTPSRARRERDRNPEPEPVRRCGMFGDELARRRGAKFCSAACARKAARLRHRLRTMLANPVPAEDVPAHFTAADRVYIFRRDIAMIKELLRIL